MRRRQLLKAGALVSASLLLPVGRTAWALTSDTQTPGRLIVIFLRGAVDGLNVVAPYADGEYYDYRPSIALAPPGHSKGLLDLDGHFGLHPALSDLMPLWQERSLAFVHASGSPDPNRSHFEAQAYMERGEPGVNHGDVGWMNRLLTALPGKHSATEALAVGPNVPLILSGPTGVANVPAGKRADRPMPMDHSRVREVFDQLYGGHSSLDKVYREAVQARQTLLTDLHQDMENASNGAPSSLGFPEDAARVAGLFRRDPRTRLAFFGLGGWDTHVNEGQADGQLAHHLKPLGSGLMTLAKGLGPLYKDTTILVISEFGRTAHENGNGGTDHGHGNVMWVLGGAVKGGRVHGQWPGLAEDQLYQKRDLAVTTDFRSVIDAVLAGPMNLGEQQRRTVFPGFTGHPLSGLV